MICQDFFLRATHRVCVHDPHEFSNREGSAQSLCFTLNNPGLQLVFVSGMVFAVSIARCERDSD
jgi:hypothetical protein